MPKASQIGKKDNYISKMRSEVKTIERKYNVTILYDQEKYKNNKLTVKFDHDETIDEVLSILEGILQNMKYKKNNDIIFIN